MRLVLADFLHYAQIIDQGEEVAAREVRYRLLGEVCDGVAQLVDLRPLGVLGGVLLSFCGMAPCFFLRDWG